MSKLQVTQPHSLSHRHAPHSITCPLRYREKAYHIWDLALEMLQHSTIHCVSHQVTVSSTKQCVADLHCCQPPWHWSLGPQALVTPSSTTTAAGPNCSGPCVCTGPTGESECTLHALLTCIWSYIWQGRTWPPSHT